jgi:nucleoside-diphosphate kinase
MGPSKAKEYKMFSERSLVILKPDAVERGLTGEIICRFEQIGLKLVAAKLVRASKKLLDQHYQVEALAPIIGKKSQDAGTDVGGDPTAYGRMVLGWNQTYMMRGPVLAMVLEGTRSIQRIRDMVGFTNPPKAAPGTIRFDLGVDTIELANAEKRGTENLIHASGNAEEARFEIGLWFPDLSEGKKS